jgi:hypothetical protein
VGVSRGEPAETDEALQEAHVSELTIKGRGTMNGWVVVGFEAVKNNNHWNNLIERATRLVRALPAKEK